MKKLTLIFAGFLVPLSINAMQSSSKHLLKRCALKTGAWQPAKLPVGYRFSSTIPSQASPVSHQQIALGKSRELRMLAFIQKTLVNDINSLERELNKQKQKLASIITELHKCEIEGKKSSVFAIQSAPLLSKDEQHKWNRIWETEEQEWLKVNAPMAKEERCG